MSCWLCKQAERTKDSWLLSKLRVPGRGSWLLIMGLHLVAHANWQQGGLRTRAHTYALINWVPNSLTNSDCGMVDVSLTWGRLRCGQRGHGALETRNLWSKLFWKLNRAVRKKTENISGLVHSYNPKFCKENTNSSHLRPRETEADENKLTKFQLLLKFKGGILSVWSWPKVLPGAFGSSFGDACKRKKRIFTLRYLINIWITHYK